MTSNEYLWAWVVYLAGAFLVFAVIYLWTRKIPWREVQHLLRLVSAVVLFLPWYTDTEHSYLSPAWIITLGDGLTLEDGAGWRAGMVLLVSIAASIFLSAIVFTVMWFKSRGAERSEA